MISGALGRFDFLGGRFDSWLVVLILFFPDVCCRPRCQKKNLGRDGPAVPSTTKVAYRPKCLSAPILYYTITILYYKCISSLFPRIFFGSLLFRIPSCFGSFLFRLPSCLFRCSFRSQLILVVIVWARL
jgi:hypothetical protein